TVSLLLSHRPVNYCRMKQQFGPPARHPFAEFSCRNRTGAHKDHPFAAILGVSTLRRRASSAASASNHSLNVLILGMAEVAVGETIQYVFCILKVTSIGATTGPWMRSHAASAVRASATPCPSTAASISMLAVRTGPRATGSEIPAASNHLDHVSQPSR